MMRVIKLGGRIHEQAAVHAAIAAAWEAAPRSLCVVHGGGDEISDLQRAFGIEPKFSGGRRVTTEDDIRLVRMALSGSANKRLVSALLDAGAPALGLSGEDAALISARIGDPTLGRVGEPVEINVHVLRALLDSTYLPVISPVARDEAGGGTLNVNGDDAAAAIAGALGADELLFISDVSAVLDAAAEPVERLQLEAGREMAGSGTVHGGMKAKLEAAERALLAGVQRVRIGDVRMLADAHAGTLVVARTPALV